MKNEIQLPLFPQVELPSSRRRAGRLPRLGRRARLARLIGMLAAQAYQVTIRQSLPVIALMLVTGCTITSYRAPSGERFTRSSLGANTSLHSLAFEATTNGLRRVELQGYQNDSSQALGTVTEAAIRAALTAAKP